MLSKHELRFHLAISHSPGNKLQQSYIYFKKHFFLDFMVLIMKFAIIEQKIVENRI